LSGSRVQALQCECSRQGLTAPAASALE
jgi:hypothetical protein